MNIVLIGMPGCGKSTVGVLLAKALRCEFVDTDLLIQNTYQKRLSQIIEEEGAEEFKHKENKVLSRLNCYNSVVATGGSAVYSDIGMKNLKQKGKIVYIKISPEEAERRIKNIKTRGIVMKKGSTISELYNERAPLYEKYADYTVESGNSSIEETVEKIFDLFSENK